MRPDGILQLVPQAVDKVMVIGRDAAGMRGGRGQVPPSGGLHPAGGIDGEAVAGREIGNPAVNRARRRHAEPREVFADGGRVDFPRHLTAGEQGI